VLLAAAVLTAAVIGPYPLPPATVAAAVARRLVGMAPESVTAVDAPIDTVLFHVRLPRIGAAALVGAALAAAGAAYQSLFRNPLVSPDILGVSTGAGLGAVLGIYLSLPVLGIQLLAFGGGLATVALVYAVAAAVRGREPVLVLVLAGVVVGALAGSAISLLKVLADPYDQLPAITFWLLGSLAGTTPADLESAVPAALLGLLPLVLLRWRIDVLALGDEEARALGVEAGRLRRLVIAAATLMTAAVVALAGQIGWVGLIVPHIARMLVGPGFALLLPTAMLLGSSYLVLVDTLARNLGTVETPLGVLTALVGAPFFLWLLARGRTGWGHEARVARARLWLPGPSGRVPSEPRRRGRPGALPPGTERLGQDHAVPHPAWAAAAAGRRRPAGRPSARRDDAPRDRPPRRLRAPSPRGAVPLHRLRDGADGPDRPSRPVRSAKPERPRARPGGAGRTRHLEPS